MDLFERYILIKRIILHIQKEQSNITLDNIKSLTYPSTNQTQ